jgi:phosphoglucosamine mutase
MGSRTPPRFGTDGVRGVANTELTPEHVLRLGRAAARVLDAPRVLVGRDTRRSSPMLEAALAAGLASEGAEVVSVGMLPTPALAWLASEAGAAAGMVTASHNPFADNGIKFFAPGGRKLADDTEARIEVELAALEWPSRSGVDVGTVVTDPAAAGRYVDHLVRLFPDGLLGGLRLVVDCAHGAMSTVAPLVLEGLGAQLTVINNAPDGCNINDQCGATHPEALAEAVRSLGADAGLAFDGDGDRVMAVDATGTLLDGDRQLAVIAPALKAEGRLRSDAVAVTVMSNLGFRLAMSRQGIRIVETAVGDRYVLEALERDGLSLGGEQSGHLIFRDLSTTGDGLLAGLVLLETVRRAGHPLAEAAARAMTSYPQVLVNVRTAQRHPDVAGLIAEEISGVEDELAGEGRVLVRASGTEPVVRVMVEAPTAAEARRAAEHLATVIKNRLG